MIALDASVIVRYLVRDDPVQAESVRVLLEGLTAQRPGFVSRDAVVELVSVLEHAYGFARPEIARVLVELAATDGLVIEAADDVMWAALRVPRGGARLRRLDDDRRCRTRGRGAPLHPRSSSRAAGRGCAGGARARRRGWRYSARRGDITASFGRRDRRGRRGRRDRRRRRTGIRQDGGADCGRRSSRPARARAARGRGRPRRHARGAGRDDRGGTGPTPAQLPRHEVRRPRERRGVVGSGRCRKALAGERGRRGQDRTTGVPRSVVLPARGDQVRRGLELSLPRRCVRGIRGARGTCRGARGGVAGQARPGTGCASAASTTPRTRARPRWACTAASGRTGTAERRSRWRSTSSSVLAPTRASTSASTSGGMTASRAGSLGTSDGT